MSLVCPSCGCSEFTADHSAVIRRTYSVEPGGHLWDVREETVDIDRDVDTLKCDDCGEEHETEDLWLQERYDAHQQEIEFEHRDMIGSLEW